MPISVWDLLPEDTPCSYVGMAYSNNLLDSSVTRQLLLGSDPAKSPDALPLTRDQSPSKEDRLQPGEKASVREARAMSNRLGLLIRETITESESTGAGSPQPEKGTKTATGPSHVQLDGRQPRLTLIKRELEISRTEQPIRSDNRVQHSSRLQRSIWECCRCSDGPKVWEHQIRRIICNHLACGSCRWGK
jgi:hypothetical protein